MSDDMSDSDSTKEETNPFEESTERSRSPSIDDETMSKLTMTGAEETSSSLTENQMASHILKRGALISGVVPSQDEEERSPPGANDLESGINPPDSDYASHAPTNLWAPSLGEDSLASGMCPPDSDYASRAPPNLAWAPNDSIVESPSNISGYDDQSTLTKRSKAFRFIGLAFISLMLIGAIIAVAMIVVGGGGDNESRANGAVTSGGGSSDTTASNGGGIDIGGNDGGIDTGSNGGGIDAGSDDGGVDTGTETVDPTPVEAPLTDRQQLMHDIISMRVSGDALQDFASPQSQARRWLLFEDTLWLSPISSFKIERIIQRYALATFYFSTDGPNSWKDNNWMDGDECSGNFWDGISCNENDEIRAIAFGKS
jgi:hypothetical protein